MNALKRKMKDTMDVNDAKRARLNASTSSTPIPSGTGR